MLMTTKRDDEEDEAIASRNNNNDLNIHQINKAPNRICRCQHSVDKRSP